MQMGPMARRRATELRQAASVLDCVRGVGGRGWALGSWAAVCPTQAGECKGLELG